MAASKFRRAAGALVGQPLVELQSIEQLKAAPGSTASPILDISEQERLAIIRDSLDRHYRNQLDQPIPALGNKSPRAVARKWPITTTPASFNWRAPKWSRAKRSWCALKFETRCRVSSLLGVIRIYR
jgi:hypothetical protein